MPYNATAIANYFLDRANAAGQEITPMKMQKLVYIAHGWNLAIHGEPLIDEPVEAWRYGPVIPSLFHALRQYGASPIIKTTNGVALPDNDDTKEMQELHDKVWEVYGKKTAIDLMRLTHAKGSPWSSVRDEGDSSSYGSIISNDVIKRHFIQLSAEARENRKKRHD